MGSGWNHASMNQLLSLTPARPILLTISPFLGIEQEGPLRRFDITSGRLAAFLAALTLGMLVPTRMAFAQG